MFASNPIFFNSLHPGKEGAAINPLPFRLLLATHSQSDVLFTSCSLATLALCIALIFGLCRKNDLRKGNLPQSLLLTTGW